MLTEKEVEQILDEIRDPVMRTFDIVEFANKVIEFYIEKNNYIS